MKKSTLACWVLLLAMKTGKVYSQELIHYWNFNQTTTFSTPTISTVNGASLTWNTGLEVLTATGQGFEVTNENARNGDVSGSHLRVNNPIDGTLVFSVPTTGFQDPKVKFTTRRSGQGAGTQTWSYSLNGTDFVVFQSVLPVDGNPSMETLDFSSILGAADNSNFKIKVEFLATGGGVSGNNRFDNLTLEAVSIGGLDQIAPTASISPITGAINVPISTQPIIAFSEAIRFIDNSAIKATTVDQFIRLKKGDENGQDIAYTAVINGNEITLQSTLPLDNNQQYTIVVLANQIEDQSDNVMLLQELSTFTTVPVQTAFQAGDLGFVGYRMNTANAEDEIAFVSFVDILPGTFLTFTDSKFTNNTIGQCANGLVWTVGANDCVSAGTIVHIQTNALTASHGTLTGSGFGLSSSGDQIIVYSGTADQPNYITALSSNGWSTTNTSCGGSNSMLPTGLVDGISAFNGSTAIGNVNGNAVNAVYSGADNVSLTALKALVFDNSNWEAFAGGQVAQEWPNWNFPTSITVASAQVSNETTIVLTFNQNVDPISGADILNYSGISDLQTATVLGNQVTLTFANRFSGTATSELIVSGVKDVNQNPMNCVFTHSFIYQSKIKMCKNFVVVNENHGELAFILDIENPATATVDLVVKGAPFSTADNSDFTLVTQTLQLTGNSGTEYIIRIPIIDDNQEEQQAEYFVLSLENANGIQIDGNANATIFIKDNDRLAKVPSNEIGLNYLGSFDPSGNNNSTCEVVAYDPTLKRLFVTSSITGIVDVINFSNPAQPIVVHSIDMNVYGGVTSVAVKNGLVAIASPNQDESLDGTVIFFDVDGTFLKQVTVGALPDNVVFSPNGKLVVTANEGQPTPNYSVDPEGSISVIDISGGIEDLTQAEVTTLYFTDFNAQEAQLIASGVRKLKASSTLSQDLEPEYVTIDETSKKAWVTLQENNAIAEINLETKTISSIWAMGTKDVSQPGNGMDVSDNNTEILIANWPVEAYYMPDAVASYSVNGTNYLITANEGDEKEYTGLVERIAVNSNAYVLDEVAFPNANVLKESYNLGRFRTTNLSGDLDGDGKFDKIKALGARSFSIFNADTKEIVFDSGDDFEMYTAAHFTSIFNADHGDNTPKSRSRAKGPEPEGVTVAKIGAQTFAFIAMERVGGVFVYNVTDPQAPIFVDYKNTRSTSAYAGDQGAETLLFIPKGQTETNKNYLVVANEVSGTLTIYEVNTNALNVEGKITDIHNKPFNIFPNPTDKTLVFFNRKADVNVIDQMGKVLFEGRGVDTLDVSNFPVGVYFVITTEGNVQKMIVK